MSMMPPKQRAEWAKEEVYGAAKEHVARLLEQGLRGLDYDDSQALKKQLERVRKFLGQPAP